MDEALIFDCDGTLADTMPAHYLAWLDILRPYGIPFPEDQFYSLGGKPTMEIARLVMATAREQVDLHRVAQSKEEAFLTRIGEVTPIEKVVSIARARRGRTPMAVASGGRRRIVELTLQQIGLLDWFPVIVTAEDTPRHKPEPDVFLEAARRLGVAPGACTVYEDTDLGVEAARRAGMRFVDIRGLL